MLNHLKRGGLRLAVLLIGLWSWSVAPARCDELGDAAWQWDFAEHLFSTGDFYRAITEYKRFLYFFPQDDHAEAARVRVVEAYVRGQWWADGNRAAEALLEGGISGELRARVLFLQGICRMRLGMLPEARASLEGAARESRDPGLRGRAQFLVGEAHGMDGAWEAAAAALAQVDRDSGLGGVAARGVSRIQEGTPLPEKSPWLAGTLAGVLPGAGHAYMGRWRDAGLVVSLNAAFAGATVEAFQNENYALAGGLALIELLWYSGNIFSAVGSAHKHNRTLSQRLIEEIQPPFGMGEQLPHLDGGTRRPIP